MAHRRTKGFLVLIVGLSALLEACSNGPEANQEAPPAPAVAACSLLSAHAASTALGESVQGPHECNALPGDQSSGLYFVAAPKPGTLSVNISWNTGSITTFTVSQSGHAKWESASPPPTYERVTVAGVPAYWQLSPTAGPGNAQRIESMKSGYVVGLTSMGLGQPQVEKALAVLLNRL